MKKIITLLTILMLVVFMVGCEKSVNPIAPQTHNDNDGISLAKGGGVIADFNIVFSGGVIEADWNLGEKVLRKNANNIQSPYNEFFLMAFNEEKMGDCLEITGSGLLLISQSNRKDPDIARIQYWFEGPGQEEGTTLTYILVMDGRFEAGAQWPPAVNNSNIIMIDTWELQTEGNPKKYKATPCVLEDFPFPSDPSYITVTVTRLDITT